QRLGRGRNVHVPVELAVVTRFEAQRIGDGRRLERRLLPVTIDPYRRGHRARGDLTGCRVHTLTGRAHWLLVERHVHRTGLRPLGPHAVRGPVDVDILPGFRFHDDGFGTVELDRAFPRLAVQPRLGILDGARDLLAVTRAHRIDLTDGEQRGHPDKRVERLTARLGHR